MATDITLFHNPRCSKSRQALTLLEEHGVAPDIRLYLKEPPKIDELRSIVTKLGITPRALLRTNEDIYKTMKLGDPDHDDQALLEAMAKYPKLIERPIAIAGKQAVIGRPPENVLTLL